MPKHTRGKTKETPTPVAVQKTQAFWPSWTTDRLFTLLVAITFAYVIVWLGTLIQLNTARLSRLGKADAPPHTITIDGTGKVTGAPTIATATLGMQTTKPDVPSAQRENSDKMNAFIAGIKTLGIVAVDIQTADYTIYPQYRYDAKTGKSTIDSYTVSQSVAVKMRDLSKIAAVLEQAGSQGLNQVSGISFTIDDPEMLRIQARNQALDQATVKAQMIAGKLGLRLARVVGFSENQASALPGQSPYARGLAVGGAEPTPPPVESGSLDVTADVSVTYEIE